MPGQIVKAPITNVDFAPTLVDLACDDCCDKRTGLCIGGASNASSNTLAPFDGRSILPLLSNENLVDSWRDEVFIEYYYNDPNVKCVENCNPKAGQYPKRTSHLSVVSKRNRQHIHKYTGDSECTELNTIPNTVCWGGSICNETCYPTENRMNNFRAIRRFDEAGTLYAEYAVGNQSNATIEFKTVDFHELFQAEYDPWMIKNLYNSTDSNVLESLRTDLTSWYDCMGSSCP